MSGLIFVFNYVSAQTYKIICKFFFVLLYLLDYYHYYYYYY